MGTENLDRSAVGHLFVNDGTGEVDIGAIKDLSVKVNGKLVQHMDVSGYPFGVDYSAFGAKTVDIEFTWEEISDILTWNKVLHGGTVSTTTAATVAVTDEHVTLAGTAKSKLLYGDLFDFDCTVVVNEIGGDTTLFVEGTDYILDRSTGEIMRFGAGIGDGDTVHVDYAYNTFVGKYFSILDASVPDEYAVRILKPLTNGDNLRIQHTKAIFGAEQEFSLNPGEEGEWAGAKSKITFLKDASTYDYFGRWEIYTP
jgi:hypothetical protein